MTSNPIARSISRISQAALAPDRWPGALQSITKAVGALGVGYLLLNKRTGRVEWVSVAGLSIDVEKQLKRLALFAHDVCPRWNYTLSPRRPVKRFSPCERFALRP